MKGQNFKIFIAFFLCIFLLGTVHAQDKKKLQKKYDLLQKEIKDIESSIIETKKKKKETTHLLQSLNAKVKTRKELINVINSQLTELDDDINDLNKDITNRQQNLQLMKKDYAEVLVHSYRKLDPGNQFLYVFSASSFNEAFNRFNYLRKYGQERKAQSQMIEDAIASLNVQKQKLEQSKQQKVKVVNDEKQQTDKLLAETTEQNELIKKLSQDESELKKKIAKKNSEAQKLNAEIQRIIEKEIAEAKRKAEEERKKAAELAKKKAANTKTKDASTPPVATTTKVDALSLTPAELALSNDFVSNKAKLPWPVERGHIISNFGKHPHPTVPEVIVENNGIDIKTTDNASVRSLFAGKVISVFYMPFNQNSVIIKHGEYFTVYSNLKSVSVSPNTEVSTKQAIGTAFTNADDGLSMVHIEIWKGKAKMDPALWLAQ